MVNQITLSFFFYNKFFMLKKINFFIVKSLSNLASVLIFYNFYILFKTNCAKEERNFFFF